MQLRNQELMEEFYSRNLSKYPELTIKQVTSICHTPFQLLRNCIEGDEITEVTSSKLPNVPNEEQIRNLEALVKVVLDPARELLGTPIGVNSGYRSPAVNGATAGSSKTSQHMTGQAADIRALDKVKLFKIIRDKLPFDQLIWEDGQTGGATVPGWIHVSYRNDSKNRGQVLRINKSGVTVPLPKVY